jgi:hypothetical protein
MQAFKYEVSGIAADTQSDAGNLRTFFYCTAYADTQAIAWAGERAGKFLHSLRITSKVAA